MRDWRALCGLRTGIELARVISGTGTSWWCLLLTCFFFFSSRRRHTRFDCDWSSDVCSSDLRRTAAAAIGHHATQVFRVLQEQGSGNVESRGQLVRAIELQPHVPRLADILIERHGRARQVWIVRQTVGLADGVVGEEGNADQAAEDLVAVPHVVGGCVENQGPVREPEDVLAADLERSEEHTSELQSQSNLVCRLLLEKKK